MPTSWLTYRRIARAAVFGLAVGLMALAGLSVWGTQQTAHTTATVRELDSVSAAWERLLGRLNAEDIVLREFLATGGTQYRRGSLAASLNSAEGDLRWLEQHGSRNEADQVRALYASYTGIVRQILDADARGASFQGYGELASLAMQPLRERVSVNLLDLSTKFTSYLAGVDKSNLRLRAVSLTVMLMDGALLIACSVILVRYQRRIEWQSAANHHLALHDPLTGLGNRASLQAHLERALEIHADQLVGLLLIDLDGFKAVNDTFGHHCGDLVLQAVGERLRAAARNQDLVARLGGDEFAVLLPQLTKTDNAVEIAARIVKAIDEPINFKGYPVSVRGSVGIATYPDRCGTAGELMHGADVAMYRAKRGRLEPQIYTSELGAPDPSPNRPGALHEPSSSSTEG